jgi:hypothetical protein
MKRAYFFSWPENVHGLIIDRRVTAHIQGDFVVFLIGMRINELWKPRRWPRHLRTMPRMLKELEAAPAEHGFLGYTNLGLLSLIQYWRSFDHLEAYARAGDKQHWPAWPEFNRLMKDSAATSASGTRPISSELASTKNIYNGMPLMGLAKAARLADVTGDAEAARGRLGAVADEAQCAPGEKRLSSPA